MCITTYRIQILCFPSLTSVFFKRDFPICSVKDSLVLSYSFMVILFIYLLPY